jgi:RNA polymerase sigma-70 factor (ECF subfamily)
VLLFQERFAQLYRYLDRLSGDSGIADDIAQESFVRLYERGAMPANPSAWLVAVANNLLRDERRNRRRRGRLLTLHGGGEGSDRSAPSPEGGVLEAERAAEVRRALDAISERDRQLLLLRHEGYSYREVADAFGIAPSSVGTLLVRATAAFTRAFKEGSGASD